MKYIHVPMELSISEMRAGGAFFSPGRYMRFIPSKANTASNFAPLDKLLVLRDSRVKVKNGDWYHYAEIGDIDVTTGGISFRKMRGYQLPDKRPSITKLGDVVISTVRTYRKGIGYVSSDAPNLVTTNAVMNVCGVTDYAPGLTLLYVYSFLRSDFFVEQVWSMLNRGVYPRMDKGALDKITIPIASDFRVIRYVSALMQAIVDKEKAIRERHAIMIQAIDAEISKNQKGQSFTYTFPTRDKLLNAGRMDAGFWSQPLRFQINRLRSYRHGYWGSIYCAGYKTRRGPNLAVSVVGPGYYYDEPTGKVIPLASPADITDYMTVSKFRYYGNQRRLDLVREGEVLFAAKGMREVSIGHTYVYLSGDGFLTNFDAFLIDSGNITRNIFLGQLLNYFKMQGIFGRLADTSNGGSFTQEHFNHLPIPRFPEEKQAEIARFYHNPAPPPKDKPTLETFVDLHRRWNADLGIWELDREMKALQSTLADVQEQIIEGKTVEVPI